MRLKRPHKRLGGFLAAAGSWLELQDKATGPIREVPAHTWRWGQPSRGGERGSRELGDAADAKGFWEREWGRSKQGGCPGHKGTGDTPRLLRAPRTAPCQGMVARPGPAMAVGSPAPKHPQRQAKTLNFFRKK